MKTSSKNSSDTNEHLSKKHYEELGRIVASIYETGYLNKAQTYKMSFLKGVLGGFGGVVGATVVVALALWLISVIGNVSIFQPFTDKAQETLQPDK